jgi:hypothetical protein
MANSNGFPPTAEQGIDPSRESSPEKEKNGQEERQRTSAFLKTQPESSKESSDIQDARHRELEILKTTGKQDWYLYALAAVVVLGFFALTVTMIVTDIPDKSQNIAYMLLGGLVTGFSMVLSYFFGSSAGSAQKTVQLTELAKSRPLSMK